MSAHITRDPFVRASLHRETHSDPKPCEWCGQPARFTYTWEDDTDSCPPRFTYSDRFCSVGCFLSYTR